jgi:hypothetical protein
MPTSWDDLYCSATHEHSPDLVDHALVKLGVLVNKSNRHGWLLFSVEVGHLVSFSRLLDGLTLSLGELCGRNVYAVKCLPRMHKYQPRGWVTTSDHTFSVQQLWSRAHD